MARILVIDDEESIRTALRRALELDGHTVILAEDGEEGETFFRENPADLVITDIIMPKREGLGLLANLLVDYPGVKIIIISGGARMTHGPDLQALLDVAKSQGACKTFMKPFELNEILESVNDLLAGEAGGRRSSIKDILDKGHLELSADVNRGDEWFRVFL